MIMAAAWYRGGFVFGIERSGVGPPAPSSLLPHTAFQRNDGKRVATRRRTGPTAASRDAAVVSSLSSSSFHGNTFTLPRLSIFRCEKLPDHASRLVSCNTVRETKPFLLRLWPPSPFYKCATYVCVCAYSSIAGGRLDRILGMCMYVWVQVQAGIVTYFPFAFPIGVFSLLLSFLFSSLFHFLLLFLSRVGQENLRVHPSCSSSLRRPED